jgi:hypothetical protein
MTHICDHAGNYEECAQCWHAEPHRPDMLCHKIFKHCPRPSSYPVHCIPIEEEKKP